MKRLSAVVVAVLPRKGSLSFTRFSLYVALLLMACSWGYLLLGADSQLGDLFQSQTWSQAGSFLGQLLGLGSDRPPVYLQGSEWAEKFRLAYRTLAMSVLAIGIAGAGALLTLLPGARNVSNGELGGRPSQIGSLVYYLVRLSYTFTRAVPELVWALIVVLFFSGGLLAGAIALGLHNFGVVGRLSSEVVENLEPNQARALRAAGASNLEMLAYGILPQAMPQLITYLLYRWEVVIRTTVVLGVVSGLGREFESSRNLFFYTDMTLILLWYLLLVLGVDLLSSWLRRLVRFG